MILVKVCELVVKEDGVFEGYGNVEFDDALTLVEWICGIGVVDESIARGLDVYLFISCAEMIRELVVWEEGEIEGIWSGGGEVLAVCVVK